MARLHKTTLRIEHMLEEVEWSRLQNTVGGAYARMPADDIRVAR